jgi:hypothetical protein
MAVEDDLRRLSEMQAIYRGWQSFFALVCTTDSPAPTATANKETRGTPKPLNQSSSEICSLAVREMGAPANVENRLSVNRAVEGGAKIKNPKSTAATRAVVGILDRHVGADS